MAWTWLRSCYKFDMRLTVGGIEGIYPARWFFCDPDAQWFPSPHGAEASPWLKSFETNNDWGEVAGQKGLDKGINPGYPGTCFVGDPQWFLDGNLPEDLTNRPPPCPPPCCGYLPPVNPDPRCPPVPYIPASFCCQEYAPVVWNLQLDLASGFWSDLNGRYRLQWLNTIIWEYTWNLNYIIIYPLGDNAYIVEIGGEEYGIPGARYLIPTPLDCFNPEVLIEAYQWNLSLPGRPPRILFLTNAE